MKLITVVGLPALDFRHLHYMNSIEMIYILNNTKQHSSHVWISVVHIRPVRSYYFC